MDIRVMNNGEPEIPLGNPTEVSAEEILPDILPGKWGQSKNQKIQIDFVFLDTRYSGIPGGGHMECSTEIVYGESQCRGEGVIAHQGYPCTLVPVEFKDV